MQKFDIRSEEHTSELQSRQYLVCRLLLEKKKKEQNIGHSTLQRQTRPPTSGLTPTVPALATRPPCSATSLVWLSPLSVFLFFFFLMMGRPPRSTLFPPPPLSR